MATNWKDILATFAGAIAGTGMAAPEVIKYTQGQPNSKTMMIVGLATIFFGYIANKVDKPKDPGKI